MTVTVCWSAKGGSGTTVVAAALALVNPGDSLLIDLDGELPAVLGIPEPAGPGVAEWLRSAAPASAIDDLTVDVDATTRLVPRGNLAVERIDARWSDLAEWLGDRRSAVVIDAGLGHPPVQLLDAGGRALLVTRACYLALRRATSVACRPSGVVVVAEPGRALGTADIETAVGAPVVASISLDPAVARAVDAGLLAARLPRGMTRELRGAA